MFATFFAIIFFVWLIKYADKAIAYTVAGGIFIIALPVAPFVSAYKTKKKHPVMAVTIVVLWSLVYLVLGFAYLMYRKS